VSVDHEVVVNALIAAGLGLDYQTVRLERTTEEWLVAGDCLRTEVERVLGTSVVGVEQIGSSSVRGLLAKPSVDLAVGLADNHDFTEVTDRLQSAAWTYRGDAGDNGGHVFVLEARPWHRVAHLHVVQHDGMQWRNYLRFRDLLSRSSEARERYEADKVSLAETHPNDREAYTDGKTKVVRELLAELA
jgi:GrpB-like predicted nucleotidyltransferase (UPF0157 family)